MSGPPATIASPSALSTSVALTAAGTYVFRLTAGDSSLSAHHDVTVYLVPPGALALHLPFDEGSGATANDISGRGRNGTLVNGPSWGPGRLGSALTFTKASANYVRVNDFPIGPAYSIAFWFKPAPGSLSGVGGYYYILSWGGNPQTANSVNVWCTGQEENIGITLRTSAQDGNDAAAGAILDLNEPGAVTFTDGDWHLYCLTVSAATGRTVYFDGARRLSDHAAAGDDWDPPTNLIIGGRRDLDPGRFFNGSVDDLRMYDSVLSDGDVLALYQGEPAAIPGDFNGDGVVTGRDFLVWQLHYPTVSGATKATGDADDDGDVDGRDFLIWQAAYRPAP